MANRNYNRYQALEKECKAIYAEVSIAAAGAPTLEKGLGVSSVERTAAGKYKITLADKYNRLMSMDVKQQAATAEDLSFQIEAEAVATDGSIDIISHTAGADTDPSSGSKLFIKIELKNSSVGE